MCLDPNELGSMCGSEMGGRYCQFISKYRREELRSFFKSLPNITKRREFVARLVKVKPVERQTTGRKSRRKKTYVMKLPWNTQKVQVCKKMLLDALGISESFVRTSIKKLQPNGKMEEEKRGGRQRVNLEKDAQKRELIKQHINTFCRVEPYFGNKESNKKCLPSDLSVTKMHSMFMADDNRKIDCSYKLYNKVFKEFNLLFDRPKKDQGRKQLNEKNMHSMNKLQCTVKMEIEKRDGRQRVNLPMDAQKKELIRTCPIVVLNDIVKYPKIGGMTQSLFRFR